MIRKSILLMALFAVALCAATRSAQAQKSWEYSPYDLRVWVALEPSPRLNSEVAARINETLARRGKIVGKATWVVKGEEAPQGVASDILYYLDQLTDEKLIEADTSDKEHTITVADKLYVVAVKDERFRFSVKVRELDMHTRVWSREQSAYVHQQELLADVVTNLMTKCFLPVMRIESITEKDVVARIRASGLIYGDSICAVPEGAVLQPVVRRNDRLGQPLRGGILVAPWTLCHVLGFEGMNVKMRLYGGKNNPLGVRKGVRTQRFAILIRPESTPTRILLRSDVIGKPDPLVGYDFYEKDPLDLDIPAKHLGKSDWRGAFDVAPNKKAFRLIYVRSGGKLMARMPTVPGQHKDLVAFMRDDDYRLQAEAYVRSVESEIMDQVVQRRLLESTITKRLGANRADDAKDLLERFQSLPKQTDMKDRLDARQGEIVAGDVDPRTARLINQLFTRTERLVAEHIDPTTLLKLQRALQAKQGN